jgi:hypothetical protein
MIQISTHGGERFNLSKIPDKCPFCHKAITPNILIGHTHVYNLEVIMFCPNEDCGKVFIGYYRLNPPSPVPQFSGETTKGTLETKKFSEKINEISSAFVKIYDQAYIAEQQDLKEICGVGYRKALEFLIKDYVILNHDDEKEKIEKTQLGNVIENFVNDTRIQSVAKRAAWLGNDETHYIRKWEGKNLDDLKKLIDLTVHWIEMETLTSCFEEDMPE